jgi:hypothetical protein
MLIITCYLILLSILLLFLLFTRNYKHSVTKQLSKKEYPLKFFYGAAFLILDFFHSLQRKFFPNKSLHNPKVRSHLEQLHVGKKIDNLEYLFYAKRISYTYVFLLVIFLLGAMYSAYALQESTPVTSLARSNDETSYSLEVDMGNDETQILDISVSAKEYNFKECLDLFEQYREDIVAELLGDNSDIGAIQYPLHFITSYGDEGLTIQWEVENDSLIEETGEVHLENVAEEGAATTVTANMTLGEYSTALTIPLTLVP